MYTRVLLSPSTWQNRSAAGFYSFCQSSALNLLICTLRSNRSGSEDSPFPLIAPSITLNVTGTAWMRKEALLFHGANSNPDRYPSKRRLNVKRHYNMQYLPVTSYHITTVTSHRNTASTDRAADTSPRVSEILQYKHLHCVSGFPNWAPEQGSMNQFIYRNAECRIEYPVSRRNKFGCQKNKKGLSCFWV